jgi:hypothetical protein
MLPGSTNRLRDATGEQNPVNPRNDSGQPSPVQSQRPSSVLAQREPTGPSAHVCSLDSLASHAPVPGSGSSPTSVASASRPGSPSPASGAGTASSVDAPPASAAVTSNGGGTGRPESPTTPPAPIGAVGRGSSSRWTAAARGGQGREQKGGQQKGADHAGLECGWEGYGCRRVHCVCLHSNTRMCVRCDARRDLQNQARGATMRPPRYPGIPCVFAFFDRLYRFSQCLFLWGRLRVEGMPRRAAARMSMPPGGGVVVGARRRGRPPKVARGWMQAQRGTPMVREISPVGKPPM